MSLKFFYNGIKGADGKLQKASYSMSNWVTKPHDMIRIYGKHYQDFSQEVRQAFIVENGSDSQTDYFEDDHIDVYPQHPLYGEVKAALLKQEAHRHKKWIGYQKQNPNGPCFCGSAHGYGSCQTSKLTQEVA